MSYRLCCLGTMLLCTVLSFAQSQDRVQQFFQRHDVNGDGQITQDEWRGPQSFFKKFDSNGDQVITKEELRGPHQGRKQNRHSQNKREKFLQRFDKDGDGRISQDEWPGPEQVFSRLDRNGDGFIEPQELPKRQKKNKRNRAKQMLQQMDVDNDGRVAQDEWQGPPQLFSRLDRNGDGFITENELPKRKNNHDSQKARVLQKLRQMDVDSDGKISQQEWQGPPQLFSRLDRNGDGYISPEDVPQKHRQPGQRRHQQKSLPPRLKQMDADNDGKVSQQEWQGPPQLFSRLDRDGDGYIAIDELPKRNSHGNNMQRPNSGNVADRLRRMDSNNDGKISQDEWQGPPFVFQRLDRNQDGEISEDEMPNPQNRQQFRGRNPQQNFAPPHEQDF